MNRILFVHHNSIIGGASYCLLRIVESLDRTKFEPVILLRGEGPLSNDFKKLGVKVIFFPEMATIPYNRSIFNVKNILAYLQIKNSINAFEKILYNEKIDTVYLNNMMLAYYLRPAKQAGCKTVLHVREHWPLDEHTHQLNWIRKIVYECCDKLISINRYSASMFPCMKATIVYDWIDMDKRYKPMSLDDIFGESVRGKKVFLYVGGMSRIKGAFEVISSFIDTLKGDDYRLLVLGFNKEINRAGITSKIKRILYTIGLPTFEYKVKLLAQKDKRIVCIPFVYEIKDIVTQAYCELSYFTIPHANLPLAEAIILGTPVIAAQTDESEEYSLDGEMAVLYRMNDVNAFRAAINDFLKNEKKLRKVLSSEKRTVVEKMFSEEENIEKVNNVLGDLLK